MTSLKKAVKLSLFVTALACTSFAHPWSKQGHETITFVSVSALNPEQRAYYAELAALLFGSRGNPKKTPLEDLENVVKFGSFPDTIRDKPLSDVFSFYGVPVPKLLLEFGDKATGRWHYHNIILRDKTNSHCKFTNRGVLINRLISLDAALKSSISKRQQALLLSFQIHLFQDLHQPLHTLTKLGSSCRHDAGGNRTCVIKKTSGRCELNLHQYWDSGFGVFDNQRGLLFDGSLNDVVASEFIPRTWASENNRFYDHIYQLDNPRYHDVSKALVLKRVSIAAKRLTQYLKAYYEYIHSSKSN